MIVTVFQRGVSFFDPFNPSWDPMSVLMADKLIEKVTNLKITADEESVVVLEGIEKDPSDEARVLAMVGRVLSNRPYNFEALKRTLNQIWSITKGALFRSIENGLFVVQFATAKDKSKVMAGRPWTFDNNLVLLEEIEGSIQPSNISLTRCPFWVRLYNLPMDSRAENFVRLIGGCIGEVLEVESDGIAWDRSARVKVCLDVSKPLRRLQKIKTRSGDLAVVEIKYERLPTFCYECGILGHIERDCLQVSDDEKEEGKQWGSWLRASPRRGRLKIMEETKEFLSCSKKLNFAAVVEKDNEETFASAITTTVVHEPHVVEDRGVSTHGTTLNVEAEVQGVMEPAAQKVNVPFVFSSNKGDTCEGPITSLNKGVASCSSLSNVGGGETSLLLANVGAGSDGIYSVVNVNNYEVGVGGQSTIEYALTRGPLVEGEVEPLHYDHYFDTVMEEPAARAPSVSRKWRKLAREKNVIAKESGVDGVAAATGKRERDKDEEDGGSESKTTRLMLDDISNGWRLARTDEAQSRPAQ